MLWGIGMRKRKKEIAVKGKTGFFSSVVNWIKTVKDIIFPPKIRFYIKGGNTISPAMSVRQIRKVSVQICKAAVMDAKYRSY